MSNQRQRIFSAALDEFVDAGFVDANLNAIADTADLEPGAVRALFIDKSALLDELLKEETDSMVSAIALAVDEIEDPKALIVKALQIYDQWLLAHPKVVDLFVRCCLDGAETLQSLFKRSLLPSEFYERLQQLIDRDALRCKDLFMLSTLLDSLILFPHMMRSALALMNPEQTTEQIIELRYEAVIDLLENGLFTEPRQADGNNGSGEQV